MWPLETVVHSRHVYRGLELKGEESDVITKSNVQVAKACSQRQWSQVMNVTGLNVQPETADGISCSAHKCSSTIRQLAEPLLPALQCGEEILASDKSTLWVGK